MKGGGGGWVNVKVRFAVLMVILFARLKDIVICRIFFTKFTLPKKKFQIPISRTLLFSIFPITWNPVNWPLPVVKHCNFTPNFSNQFASLNVFQKVWFHCMCKLIFVWRYSVKVYCICLLITVKNASAALGGVDRAVQRADELKNLTANLQAQLRQNMSVLEEKLRRAKEYVAKVDNLSLYWTWKIHKCAHH